MFIFLIGRPQRLLESFTKNFSGIKLCISLGSSMCMKNNFTGWFKSISKNRNTPHLKYDRRRWRKHTLPSFLPLPTRCQFCYVHLHNWSVSIIPSCTYQRCRIELRDDMMDEDGEVSRSRLQQVDALEAATLSVNLTEEEERTGARVTPGKTRSSWKSFSSDRRDQRWMKAH